MNCDPDALMAAAKCLSCIPSGRMESIASYLLCQWAQLASCDSDAVKFLQAVGIDQGSTNGQAICNLVSDLKNTVPAGGGLSFWERDVLIYPIVGGTAASHAVNLKDPAGSNNLAYTGAGLVHSALGMKGDGVASYASTNYLIASANSVRVMCYIDAANTLATRMYFGCATNAAASRFLVRNNGANFECSINDATTSAFDVTSLGAIFVERFAAGSRQSSNSANNWVPQAVASTGQQTRYLTLLAYNNGGVAPVGSGTTFADGRISGFSLGAPLDTAGGTNAERLQYKAIWDRYETALGRGH